MTTLYNRTETNVKTVQIIQEIETRQIGQTKQDHVVSGTYSLKDITTCWAAAFDGHGTNQAIDIIRNADMNTIMQSDTPHKLLQELIQADSTLQERSRSGSTMVYAKVTPFENHTNIEVVNIGDSSALVMVNDKPIFVTTPHNCKNGAEILRLITEHRITMQFSIIQMGTTFEVMSPTTVSIKQGLYIRFIDSIGKYYELTPSQSLGHDGMTGFAPTITNIRVLPSDNVRIFLFSDGVGDVLPTEGLASASTFAFMKSVSSTTELLNEAERRWCQEWMCNIEHDTTTQHLSSFESNGYDDCCCAMMSITPANIPVL